ncbi:MAG: thiamine-phosphate kinase [Terriglobia bacterium]
MNERQFTDLLTRLAAAAPRTGLRQGIGDDCAVLAHTRQRDLLVTTDLFLEGIHFRRHWQEPASLGHKALARGLSDIAAMGGAPRFAFLSLGLPRKSSPRRSPPGQGWDQRWNRRWPQRQINGFLEGFFRLAAASKVVLAGGDTGSSAGGFLADVVVVGDVPRGQAILRSGARPGDEIWVSGTLGTAALGLAVLQRGEKLRRSHAAFQAFCCPEPRLRIGQYLLRRKLASAMMDLSDGLSIDLARLCEASGVGARLDSASLPRLTQTSLHNALHGGEDLELLFTVSPQRSPQLPRSIGGVPLTRIGQITSERKLWLLRDNRKQPLPILGFQHF